MIDFSKITDKELREIKSIASKASEKSDLEKYYLFSHDPDEKGKMFIYCHRFLINVFNLLEIGDLKNAIGGCLNETSESYDELLYSLFRNTLSHFQKARIDKRIFIIVNDIKVDELIDVFSILIERANILQVSRLKGFILEGKSGEEYKKTFNNPAE